jgi:hypothetical protein
MGYLNKFNLTPFHNILPLQATANLRMVRKSRKLFEIDEKCQQNTSGKSVSLFPLKLFSSLGVQSMAVYTIDFSSITRTITGRRKA